MGKHHKRSTLFGRFLQLLQRHVQRAFTRLRVLGEAVWSDLHGTDLRYDVDNWRELSREVLCRPEINVATQTPRKFMAAALINSASPSTASTPTSSQDIVKIESAPPIAASSLCVNTFPDDATLEADWHSRKNTKKRQRGSSILNKNRFLGLAPIDQKHRRAGGTSMPSNTGISVMTTPDREGLQQRICMFTNNELHMPRGWSKPTQSTDAPKPATVPITDHVSGVGAPHVPVLPKTVTALVDATVLRSSQLIALNNPRCEFLHAAPFADELFAEINNLIREFHKQGYRLSLYGGTMRSLACRHRPSDFDFITDASPNEISRIMELLVANHQLRDRAQDRDGLFHATTTGCSMPIDITSIPGEQFDERLNTCRTGDITFNHFNYTLDQSNNGWLSCALPRGINAVLYDLSKIGSPMRFIGGAESLTPLQAMRALRTSFYDKINISEHDKPFIYRQAVELLQNSNTSELYKWFSRGRGGEALIRLLRIRQLRLALTSALHIEAPEALIDFRRQLAVYDNIGLISLRHEDEADIQQIERASLELANTLMPTAPDRIPMIARYGADIYMYDYVKNETGGEWRKIKLDNKKCRELHFPLINAGPAWLAKFMIPEAVFLEITSKRACAELHQINWSRFHNFFTAFQAGHPALSGALVPH